MYHMDVKLTYLNGTLEEEVHVEQPSGFQVKVRFKSAQVKEGSIRAETSP